MSTGIKSNIENKHLIVVSVDALVYEDLEYAKTLPAFSYLLEQGSRINKVKTIYPALTHPIHAAIMTGCPAGKTGIPSNEIFEAGKTNRPWYNSLSEVKCDTIFHAAKRAGLTTAACRWPVTARGDDVIDYLVPEIMDSDMEGYEDDILTVYRNLGTQEELMDIVEKAVQIYGSSHSHPAYDEFEIYCACEIIKRYKPNLLFTHPGFVDGERHRTGVFSEDVKNSILVTDHFLTMLFDALKEAGIFEKTDFVVLSDHGQLDIKRAVCPNVYLADAGLINVSDTGELLSYDAFSASCGLSSQVYLKDPDNKEIYQKTYDLLKNLAKDQLYGFEEVYTKEEVEKRYGLSGDFSFVLETDGFTSFHEDFVRPVVRSVGADDYRQGKATHGHRPEKGLQPPFLCMGPSFQRGVVIENGDILNHAPTFAKLLGTHLKDAVGVPVMELLK